MTSDALGSDRIDVTDEDGICIGWVDTSTGDRHLLVADRAHDFDDMIEFWLTAAGLSDGPGGVSPGRPLAPVDGAPEKNAGESGLRTMRVSEVRYPDPEVVRSLVVPLVHLTAARLG